MTEQTDTPDTVEVEDETISESPEEAAPKKTTAPKKKLPRVVKDSVMSGKDTDPVLLAKLIAPDPRRKSLSVLHLQRRLALLGYSEAAADASGKYGKLTANAFALWQADNGYSGTIDHDQAVELFANDPNVTLQ